MRRSHRVVHMSSVHHVSDTRVFHKECVSLAEAGFDVTLIINADDSAVVNGVSVRALPKRRQSRFSRFTRTTWHVYRIAREVDGELYHFHDPELVPVGVILKLSGKKVVFDAHEHVAKQILTKRWIPQVLRKSVSVLYRAFERICSTLFFDAVVVADPTQETLYPNQKVLIVENFPIIGEVESANSQPYEQRAPRVTYVGGITRLRGAKEMVRAVEVANRSTDTVLSLGGRISPDVLKRELQAEPGWEHVDYRGFLGRREVYELLGESRVGIVVLHPVPNYLTSQPVKLLEYMLAGLPVVVCDFPYYRQYVKEPGCGLLVDSLNVEEIGAAIVWLLQHPEEAEEMGRRGREAVLTRYNWAHEADKLVGLYDRLLSNVDHK